VNTTSTSTTEQAKPSVARGEIGSRLIGITLVVVWLLFWEWIVRFGLGQKFFSSPSNIFALFYQSLLVTGELRTPLFATVTRLVGGLMIGVVPALSLGFIMGNRRAWLRYDPFFTVLGLIPTLAALPWFIIMFGVGDFGKWMIVGAAVFYPILYCTTKGVQISRGVKDRSSSLDVGLQENNWSYSAGPWIFTGLNSASSSAWQRFSVRRCSPRELALASRSPYLWLGSTSREVMRRCSRPLWLFTFCGSVSIH